jgi:hypothetical protein
MTSALGSLEHCAGLIKVFSEGLLTQDVTVARYRNPHQWPVGVRRRCHSDDLGACATDRLVEIRESSWHTVSSSTSVCAFSVRANETDNIEARGAQRGNVNSATEPSANDQRRYLSNVHAGLPGLAMAC